MTDWKDLQAEFQALAPALQDARLDYQGGAAGEHWRIAGGADRLARERFEAVARLASHRLAKLPPGHLEDEVVTASNPLARWYHALRRHSGIYETDGYGYQVDDAGNRGLIFGGTVRRPAEASALLCLKFSALELEADSNESGLHQETPTSETSPAEASDMPNQRRFQRMNLFIANEAKQRGYLWLVIGFLITVLVSILA